MDKMLPSSFEQFKGYQNFELTFNMVSRKHIFCITFSAVKLIPVTILYNCHCMVTLLYITDTNDNSAAV